MIQRRKLNRVFRVTMPVSSVFPKKFSMPILVKSLKKLIVQTLSFRHLSLVLLNSVFFLYPPLAMIRDGEQGTFPKDLAKIVPSVEEFCT